MTGNLKRLQELQDVIHGAYGGWGTNELANGCAAAAEVDGFGGDPAALGQIAAEYQSAHAAVREAYQSLLPLQEQGVSGVWAGDATVSADETLTAVTDDVLRGAEAIRVLSKTLDAHAATLAWYSGQDESAIVALLKLAAQAREMTMLGFLPNLTDYDGARMREIHAGAMAAIDERVASNIAMRNAAEDFTGQVHELQCQARASRLGPSPLSAVDEVVIADAGQDIATGHEAVLTAAMDDRAATALAKLNDADRSRVAGLLAAASSPEQRAHLMKALAAGYSVDDVDRFNSLIAAHGNDPDWLDQHLSPLAMDGPVTGGIQDNTFDGTEWTQGSYPTCVASSTVTARAEVDPIYALQLTTGGHPDDPSLDNPSAFADRLRAEQDCVYEGGRHWYENAWHDGMTDAQSTRIANEAIAIHTGVAYEGVAMDDQAARAATVPSIERAIDDGYPVPLGTYEKPDCGHQMMVIGHSGDLLQIYNPWGYSYWISEDDFVNGHVDTVQPEIPSTPDHVSLPKGID
ncbi:MAG: hypothetical protein QOH97_4530 [Actinoplanes sp.]|nr:hypothetical protein [Actinoplanes sp.]